jgi:hypothetical protein
MPVTFIFEKREFFFDKLLKLVVLCDRRPKSTPTIDHGNMSTIDTFARVVRATGAKPPIEYLRGKWVQRVMMLNDGFFFTSSSALVACCLDPSHGKVLFFSFDDHECPHDLAEKLHITTRNHVYILPNSTVLFSEATVPHHITITTSETQFAASTIVASTTHDFQEDEVTSLIKDLHPIANERAPFLKMHDVDGWCDQFVVANRCVGTFPLSIFTSIVSVGFRAPFAFHHQESTKVKET